MILLQRWYVPPSPTMLSPLPRRKSEDEPSRLSIGYGSFGTDPICFLLAPDVQVDIGLLKVFVSSAYVDPVRLAKQVAPSSNQIWDSWNFMLTVENEGISV
jgi:hypothetical protein